MDIKNRIARRITKEIRNGDIVNCGFGLPTLVPAHMPPDHKAFFHSENGVLGAGPPPPVAEADPDLTNAMAYPITLRKGGVFFDSVTAFAMMRSGAVTLAILGAIQVDENGDLANWTFPGQPPIGIGGAMDLANGAQRVIAATEHCTKDGSPKILNKCTFPLTAQGKVNLIVTEKAVIEVTPDGLVLKEVSGDSSLEEVVDSTEARLIVADDFHISKFF